jgi:hypothetical protein
VAIVVNHPGLNVRLAAVKSLFTKNLFRSKKQLQSHARHWHNRTSQSSNLNDSRTYHKVEEVNGTQDSAELDGTQEVYDNPEIDAFRLGLDKTWILSNVDLDYVWQV